MGLEISQSRPLRLPFWSGDALRFYALPTFYLFPNETVQGVAIHFHSDFFCIHQHHKDVACNGVLFNNIYQPTFLAVDGPTALVLADLVVQIKAEMQTKELAQHDGWCHI